MLKSDRLTVDCCHSCNAISARSNSIKALLKEFLQLAAGEMASFLLTFCRWLCTTNSLASLRNSTHRSISTEMVEILTDCFRGCTYCSDESFKVQIPFWNANNIWLFRIVSKVTIKSVNLCSIKYAGQKVKIAINYLFTKSTKVKQQKKRQRH